MNALVGVSVRLPGLPPRCVVTMHVLDRLAVGHFQYRGKTEVATAAINRASVEFVFRFPVHALSPLHTDLRLAVYDAAAPAGPDAKQPHDTTVAEHEPPADAALIGYAFINLNQIIPQTPIDSTKLASATATAPAPATAATATATTVRMWNMSGPITTGNAHFLLTTAIVPPAPTPTAATAAAAGAGARADSESPPLVTTSTNARLFASRGVNESNAGAGARPMTSASTRSPTDTSAGTSGGSGGAVRSASSLGGSIVSPRTPAFLRSPSAASAGTTEPLPCDDLARASLQIALSYAATAAAAASARNMSMTGGGPASPLSPSRPASGMGMNRPQTAGGEPTHRRPGTAMTMRGMTSSGSIIPDSADDESNVIQLTAANGDTRLAWFESPHTAPPPLPPAVTPSGSSSAAAAAVATNAAAAAAAMKRFVAHRAEHERAHQAAIASLPATPQEVDELVASATARRTFKTGAAWQLYFTVDCRNMNVPNNRQTGVVVVAFAADVPANPHSVLFVGRTELVRGTSAPNFYEPLSIIHYDAMPDREFVLTAYDVVDDGTDTSPELEHKHILGSTVLHTSLLVKSLHEVVATTGLAASTGPGTTVMGGGDDDYSTGLASSAPVLCFPLLAPGSVLHPHHTRAQYAVNKPVLRVQCVRAIQLSGAAQPLPPLSDAVIASTLSASSPSSTAAAAAAATAAATAPTSPMPVGISSPARRASLLAAERKSISSPAGSGGGNTPLKPKPPPAFRSIQLTLSCRYVTRADATPRVALIAVVCIVSHLPRMSALGFTNPVVLLHKSVPTAAAATAGANGSAAAASSLQFLGQTEAVLHTCNPDFDSRISVDLSAIANASELLFSVYSVGTTTTGAAAALTDQHLIGRVTASPAQLIPQTPTSGTAGGRPTLMPPPTRVSLLLTKNGKSMGKSALLISSAGTNKAIPSAAAAATPSR